MEEGGEPGLWWTCTDKYQKKRDARELVPGGEKGTKGQLKKGKTRENFPGGGS